MTDPTSDHHKAYVCIHVFDATRPVLFVSRADGDWWYCDGHKVAGTAPGSQTGRRFEEPDALTRTDRLSHIRLGGYIPDERIKDMDLDGVAAEVVYPTVGFLLYNMIPDRQLLSACFSAYNDWMAEFCNAYPSRLKGVALINLDDVQEGIAELQRARRLGLAGVLIAAYPWLDRPFHLEKELVHRERGIAQVDIDDRNDLPSNPILHPTGLERPAYDADVRNRTVVSRYVPEYVGVDFRNAGE